MIVLLARHSNNQPVSLTKQIANSGEGQVWETNLSGYLAKIYHDPTPARIAKLKVMLANPPADPMLSHNHVSIAWVSDLLKDSNGKYLGFLMPAIADSKQLSSVYNPRRRKQVAPGFNWYYLHVTALNTAWIIQEIHAKGYVLGDIKLENILVNNRAMTAVIDTDSFQVRDPQSNQVYRCTVGSEGFTPPELLGKDFDTTNQTEIHDRFRLGVLIHYLLFGYHPFSGNWTGVGESPEQTELIKQGYWYGGHNSPIRASKTTIPLDVVHPELKQLFLKCFNEGHTKPHLRPTAQDWHNALEVAVNQLTSCSRVDSHHYSKTYGKCYWCDRAANLDIDIFPGVAGTAKIPSSTDLFEKKVNTLSNVIEALVSIKIKKDSLPIKLKEEKHKMIKKLEEMQNCAQYRQKQESQSRNLKIQQLQKYEDEISLELIKIDIEISDMQGFNNSYINSLLAALHQKKESLRLKLMKIEQEKKQLIIQPYFYTSEEKKLKSQLIQQFNDLDDQYSKELAKITSQIEEKKANAEQLSKELASFNITIPNDLIFKLNKHNIISTQ
ncbi:MAG: hypothetical protein HC939_13485 [Pleurocapsa sp. SU_5_0]|nr:hypothetical protein [Pleurocapsa sp. SU_5_0]